MESAREGLGSGLHSLTHTHTHTQTHIHSLTHSLTPLGTDVDGGSKGLYWLNCVRITRKDVQTFFKHQLVKRGADLFAMG